MHFTTNINQSQFWKEKNSVSHATQIAPQHFTVETMEL